MAFTGFPAEALEFFEGLEADNSKAYWQDHKAVYDKQVKAPMEALLSELAQELGGEYKVFRPYRDVRFSADKAPYKTNIAATLTNGGYVSLSAEGLSAGTGYYMPSPDQLDRFRRAVADDRTGEPLARLVDGLRKKGIEVTAHEVLKTAPRGFDKDHPRIELLRHKGLICWKAWPVAAWLGTKAAKAKVLEFLATSKPLNNWLDEHVGPPRS
jgi:uncharacterized protein (TIGR02453 family)